MERLAQEVWHGEPPPSATNLIRQYVFRLRRSLPPAVSRTIVTGPGGYKLRLTRGDVDSHLFDANVVRGRAAFAAGRLEDAVRALSEALAAWRGDPLADVDPSPSILAETRRLGERRLLAIEMRADAYLRLGWYDEAVEELAALVTLHPERERLRDMQMRVLCRVGRRADALAVYRDLRQTWPTGWASNRGRSCNGCTDGCSTATRHSVGRPTPDGPPRPGGPGRRTGDRLSALRPGGTAAAPPRGRAPPPRSPPR